MEMQFGLFGMSIGGTQPCLWARRRFYRVRLRSTRRGAFSRNTQPLAWVTSLNDETSHLVSQPQLGYRGMSQIVHF